MHAHEKNNRNNTTSNDQHKRSLKYNSRTFSKQAERCCLLEVVLGGTCTLTRAFFKDRQLPLISSTRVTSAKLDAELDDELDEDGSSAPTPPSSPPPLLGFLLGSLLIVVDDT